jgi:hypothetical protein
MATLTHICFAICITRMSGIGPLAGPSSLQSLLRYVEALRVVTAHSIAVRDERARHDDLNRGG